MINENLHKKPVALDRQKHHALKLDVSARDLSTVASLNAFFVAGTEFGDACKEHPLVFVHAGQDDAGKPQVAPIAVFGLRPNQNLCVEADGWRVRYVPAALRLYPFGLARLPPDQAVLCFDDSWVGFHSGAGVALFDEGGEPSEFTLDVQRRCETFEQEVERTKLICALLVQKDLLRDMRFDATLPDGEKLTVDGFLTIDQDRLNALSDADVLELHRNGVMGLIHAHQLSLSNMARLVEWHAQRVAASPAA